MRRRLFDMLADFDPSRHFSCKNGVHMKRLLRTWCALVNGQERRISKRFIVALLLECLNAIQISSLFPDTRQEHFPPWKTTN